MNLHTATIIDNVEEYRELVQYCYIKATEPKRFPCAVRIDKHSGAGHCSDWKTSTVIQAPNLTDVEQKAYLQGVIKAWRII